MKDHDYLWDPSSAPPESDVASLERKLRPLRHQGEAPHVPVLRKRPSHVQVWAGVAAIAAVAMAGLYVSAVREGGPQFYVTTLDGAPQMCTSLNDPDSHVPVEEGSTWRTGDWLVTDTNSIARVKLNEIGEMEVAGGSQIQLVRAQRAEHRFALQAGRIDAHVTAPPRLFVVETPAATAYDMGCAYSLEVDERGGGRLHVTSGWVEMVAGPLRTVVPADAFCQTEPNQGPGLTWVDGAPQSLVDAIVAFDADPSDRHARAVLEQARPRDSITLWHLLQRTEGDVQQQVFDRLSAQVAPEVDTLAALNRYELEQWLFALLDEYWIVERPEPDRRKLQNK